MNKKKNQSRAIKEISKNFSNSQVYKAENQSETEEKNSSLVKEQVNPVIMKDLRKVIIGIAVTILFIAILGLIVYKTDLVSPFLQKFNISY